MTPEQQEAVAEFPPLLSSLPLTGRGDPLAEAVARARAGCDAGLIAHNITADEIRAAIVFAPEVALRQALTALPLCGVGLQNALGAMGPPEVAVQLRWQGDVLLNGARCGGLSAAASTADPADVPDWLVVGMSLDLIPQNDDAPGATPDRTSLYDEGCSEIHPVRLLEAWARHCLVWLNRWSDDGAAQLHREYTGLLADLGKPVHFALGQGDAAEPVAGTFTGVDEDFAMLLKTETTTRALPLSALLIKDDAL